MAKKVSKTKKVVKEKIVKIELTAADQEYIINHRDSKLEDLVEAIQKPAEVISEFRVQLKSTNLRDRTRSIHIINEDKDNGQHTFGTHEQFARRSGSIVGTKGASERADKF